MLNLLFEYLHLLNYLLAVFKGLELVQLVPLYSSVADPDTAGVITTKT
jgi:hypothetical protein